MGQHFLIDSRVLRRIAAAAEIGPQDHVLEIGPGAGALTRHLVSSGARVTAIELDPFLAAALPERLGNPPNLNVVQGDARTLDLDALLGPVAAYKVVGNLPYYAANPIIRRFLELKSRESIPQPQLIVATLQEEVAHTITATPGKMGMLSVAVQFYAAPRLVCSVPPRAFRPPPKVKSAVIRLDVRESPAVDVADADGFFDLVRAGFSSPRKQLRNSLAHGLGVAAEVAGKLLAAVGLDGSRRPATLSLEEWASVYRAWEGLAEKGLPD